MKSIRIGNDIRIEWPIVLSGDVSKLQDLDLTVEVRPSAKIIDTHNYADEIRNNDNKRLLFEKHETTVMMNGGLECRRDIGDGKEHCRPRPPRPCPPRPIPPAPVKLPYHIEDNTLIAMWTADRQFATGDYDIILYAHKNEGGQAVCDQYRFVRLVSHTAQADAPDDSGIEAVIAMQPVTLELSGLSAYEVAVINGFQGTEEEWLQSLKQPAIDAAEQAKEDIEQFKTETKTELKQDIDNLNANTGVDDYEAFSESKAYTSGDVVNYNGKLYKFTSDHAVGEWTGTDVKKISLKTIVENNYTQFSQSKDTLKSIKGIYDKGFNLMNDENGEYVHSQFFSFNKNDDLVYNVQGNPSVYPIIAFDDKLNIIKSFGNPYPNTNGSICGKDIDENIAFVQLNWTKSNKDNDKINILKGVYNSTTNIYDLLPNSYIDARTENPVLAFSREDLLTSTFIPIDKNSIYQIKGSAYRKTNYYNVNYYDSEYNWVNGYREDSEEIIIGSEDNPIPDSAVYVRIVVKKNKLFKFNKINIEDSEAYDYIKSIGGTLYSTDTSGVIIDGYMESNGSINTSDSQFKHTKKIRINQFSNKTSIITINDTSKSEIPQIIGLDKYGKIVTTFGAGSSINSVRLYTEITKSEHPNIYYIVFNITVKDGEKDFISIIENEIEQIDSFPYITTLKGGYVRASQSFNINASTLMAVSKFIPIIPNMFVIGSEYDHNQNFYNINFYNKNFEIIRGYKEDKYTIQLTQDIIPEDAAYIRINTLLDNRLSIWPVNLNSKLINKTYWTIFDSLGASNQWQKTFSLISGSIFHAELNNLPSKPISMGGTKTGIIETNCGQARAKNLVSYKGIYPIDYVFIENVNDEQMVYETDVIYGSINDKPWFQGERIVGHDIFETKQAAESFVENNFETLLSSTEADKRKKGAFFVFPYKSSSMNAFNISILSTATSNGTAFIIKDNQRFGIEVTQEMSIQDIVNSIVNYSYGNGWISSDNGDGSANISYYTDPGATEFSFDANGTGIQVIVSKTYTTQNVIKYFFGYSASEWEDLSYWEGGPTLWSQYKGLIEYLKTELPNALLYWVIPNQYSISFQKNAPYMKSDGSFDIDKYKQTSNYIKYKTLVNCQKEVCAYYDIPVIDLEGNSNINLFNIKTFYNENNPHPKQEGYDRWAQTLYDLIC